MERKYSKPSIFFISLFGFILLCLIQMERVWAAAEIIGKNGEFIYPDNTYCKAFDYDTALNNPAKNRTINALNQGIKFYESCLGSFPKYASTKVEEGMQPVYYARYYFYPDPMPVYKEVPPSQLVQTVSGNILEGLNFRVDADISYESKEEPSHHELFLLFPYNKEHNQGTASVPFGREINKYVTGPYQIGYNSFYHNTYRSRYFAYQVRFDFVVYEPKQDAGSVVTFDGQVIDQSVKFFEGDITYEMPETCYNNEYLIYEEDCQYVEFYFPKGDIVDKSENKTDFAEAIGGIFYDTMATNEWFATGEEKNTVPKDRVYYRNPGKHVLDLKVTERLAVRTQKDLGTEYQTIGNPDSKQGENMILSNGVVYFPRNDTDLFGGPILPLMEIKRVYNENYRNTPAVNYEVTDHYNKTVLDFNGLETTVNGTFQSSLMSGKYDITKLNGGHYDYSAIDEFLNTCTLNTDEKGNVADSRKPYTAGDYLLSIADQKESACYHDNGALNHFWQYRWSEPHWYHVEAGSQ